MRSSTKMKLFKEKISFIFLIFMVFSSCSSDRQRQSIDPVFGTKDYADSIVSNVTPKWFEGAKRFNLVDMNGQGLPHFFFDVSPEVDIVKKKLNFVVVTPEDSQFRYGLEISSGQRYVKNEYCEQRDVWGKYTGKINRPPFTTGVVPRYLDQLGQPQKIIIFGGGNYYRANYKKNYFDGRIIGGYIEQTCHLRNCPKVGDWKSRLVLIGVPKDHKKLSSVKNLNDLKKHFSWKRAKAFIENGNGSNVYGGKYYPGFRVGALVSGTNALNFMEKNSIYFSLKKMKSMRLSCYKLYDYLWKDLGHISKDEKKLISLKDQYDLDSLKEKAHLLSSLRRDKSKLFYQRMIKSFKVYGEEYRTCSRFVYQSNINDGGNKFWILQYFRAFNLMSDLGFSFDCNSQKWTHNPYVSDKLRAITTDNELTNCTEQDIDRSFPAAILMLKELRKKKRESYRFISYDRGAHGTHSKMYAWTRTSNKQQKCVKAIRELPIKTFPKDIKWRRRALEGKAKIGDIIY